MKQIICCAFISFITMTSYSQDTTKKTYQNTVKLNITNPLIFGKNVFIFGYERTLKKNRSINFNFGITSLPRLTGIDGDSIGILSINKNSGFHFATEYRFYLGKENKHTAPRGVYIAPYYSFNKFNRNNTWSVNKAVFTGNVNTDLNFRIHTVGVELGYQFVLWDKMTIDMILIGPGISSYKLNASVSTDVSLDIKKEIYEKIADYLGKKIPGYQLVFTEREFSTGGATTLTGANFRYLFQIGYRF